MMTSDFAHALKSLREAAGLSLEALARRANTSKSYLGNIERGRRTPSVEIASHLDRALDSGDLLTRMARRTRMTGLVAREPDPAQGRGIEGLFHLAAAQAREEVELIAAETADGEEPMPQVAAIALRYQNGDRFTAFLRARALVSHVHRRTAPLRRPADIADTYLAASLAYALMSSIAFDYARLDAAPALAGAAADFAGLAGHPDAMAWARGMQATLANWMGEPMAGLRYAEAGMAVARSGPSRFRLLHLQARSHALRLDTATVATALERAEREWAAGGTDEVQEMGGEFRFGRARATACAAAAWLDAAQAQRAEAAARLSLAAHHDAAVDEALPVGPLHGASVDLAVALLWQGEFDEAVSLLAPVTQAASTSMAMTSRLDRVKEVLAAPRWAGDARARELSAMLGSVGGEDV